TAKTCRGFSRTALTYHQDAALCCPYRPGVNQLTPVAAHPPMEDSKQRRPALSVGKLAGVANPINAQIELRIQHAKRSCMESGVDAVVIITMQFSSRGVFTPRPRRRWRFLHPG